MIALNFDPRDLIQSAVRHGLGISFPQAPKAAPVDKRRMRERDYQREYKRRWREDRARRGLSYQ